MAGGTLVVMYVWWKILGISFGVVSPGRLRLPLGCCLSVTVTFGPPTKQGVNILGSLPCL